MVPYDLDGTCQEVRLNNAPPSQRAGQLPGICMRQCLFPFTPCRQLLLSLIGATSQGIANEENPSNDDQAG